MKRTLKRLFASLMVVVMVLTAAPLSGFVGLELPLLYGDRVKAVNSSAVCLGQVECVDEGHYTGNLGDSRVYKLDATPFNGYEPYGDQNALKRNGNVGVDGSVYTDGFEVWIARWNYGDNISWAYRTFNLNNNFKFLSGSTGLIESYNTTHFDTTIYFYGDNKLLDSIRLTPTKYDYDFNINVSGVLELKVLVEDNIQEAGGTSLALYDLFLDKDTDQSAYEVGDLIEFGSYPQTEVTDTTILSALNSLSLSWASYGYYSGTGDWDDGQMQPGDYMKYADVTYKGERYRAVKFTEYRPYATGYKTTSGYTYQDDNGYYTNTVYWFKFEPLKWRVLDPDEGFMVCESIIDSQPYNNTVYYKNINYWQDTSCTTYANDYATSSIRDWLNDDFYHTAFTAAEKAQIQKSAQDNSCYYPYNPQYDSATTNDKIFLLSWDEVTNSEYGFNSSSSAYDTARSPQGTDYAKAQGLHVYNNSTGSDSRWWWLRSPGGHDSYYACLVYNYGICSYYSVNYTSVGVRPALKLKLNDMPNKNVFFEDGLNVFTQNSSMTYVKGDIVLFAASQVENGILSIPEKLSVTVNNTDVAEVFNIYTYDDIANSSFSALFEHFPEELKKSSFVVFKTKNEGTSVLTLTNTETGDSFSTMISVFEDEYESIRADNIPVKYDRGEEYNYCLNGMVVSDFDYEKVSSGYNFTFNCYNQRYSLGVVEVCDSDGTIIQVEKIDKFSNGSSIVGVFKDGWNLAKSFYHGEAMTFKGSQIAKCTPVEVFVPENGFIRITNDSAVSTTCFLVNLFDAIMTAGGIIGDTASLTPKQIDIVDKAVLKKFISNTYYLEFAKNYQEKMANMVIEETTESALLSLISQAGGMAKGLLMDIDLTFEDICGSALGTAFGIGESIFEKVSGPAGVALSVMFSSQKVLDYATQMMNWCITTNKECFAFVMTPFNYDNITDELNSPDGIKVETNDNVEPETILQTYRVLNNGINIELGSGEVINDPTLYNIALIKGGKEVQPNGKVRVYIPVPEGYGEDITVLRKNNDGSWEIITNETVENGIISFDVTHFCLFAIVDKNIDNEIQSENGKVNSVSIDDISMSYKDGGAVAPSISVDSGVKYTVTYSSSNTDVVSVDANGNITTNGTGDATITVTVTDEYGNTVTDTCNVNVSYKWWQWIIVIVLFGWIWY